MREVNSEFRSESVSLIGGPAIALCRSPCMAPAI